MSSTQRRRRLWQRCFFFTLLIIFIWHQGYFFLADIYIKEEEKMIAERISAQVFNQQDKVPQIVWRKLGDKMLQQGGWHGWRRFQLAKKEVESRHQHCFYFQLLSSREKVENNVKKTSKVFFTSKPAACTPHSTLLLRMVTKLQGWK